MIASRSECLSASQPFAIKAARCEFKQRSHSPDTPPAFASPHHESSASAHVYVGAPVGASDGGIADTEAYGGRRYECADDAAV